MTAAFDEAGQARPPAEAPALYRHRQIAWATVIGLAASLVTQGTTFARNWRRGRRSRALLSLPWSLSALVSMGMFVWLDTEVTDDALVASFVGRALRRRIALDEIESATVVTLPWYFGWGARLTPRGWLGGAPRGWLFSVWGRRAVALRLRGDRHFTVGSDEPEALLAAIEAARASAKTA